MWIRRLKKRRSEYRTNTKRLARETCRNKEIRSCLPVGWFVSHIDKVLSCFVRGSEVCHLSLINNADLVKELIERLSCLVYGNDGGGSIHIRSDAQSSAESEEVAVNTKPI